MVTYSDTGVDLTLLRENRRQSIENRLLKNSHAIHSVLAFQRACRGPSFESSSVMTAQGFLNVEGLIRRLADCHVEYILIGGLAMRAHGSAHLTEDADFLYCRTPENIRALAEAMAPLHPYLRGAPAGLPFKFDAPTIQTGLNFTLTSDYGDVDFLGHVGGLGEYEKALRFAEDKEVFGVIIKVLSLDGLIVAKRAAGRAKDHGHLLELEELKKLRQSEGG